MIKVTNRHAEKKLPIEEVFTHEDTCILEDGRIAFWAWMDESLFNKLKEEDSILCFTINDDGEANIECISTDTLATPCTVEVIVD